MNFPKFWAKGISGSAASWGWSSESMTEAQSRADKAAQELAVRLQNREHLTPHWGYYPNRPLREQVLQEIKNEGGEVVAAVTRNSYGCQVLNTARVMFVDVDLPEGSSSGGFLSKLFGKPKDPQADAIAKAEEWTRSHPDWGWRIYRTRAGLRLLATHAVMEADGPVASEVFEALGADPLYRILCKTQKSYRARLTPKPWRCGVYSKPEPWPWLDARKEQRYKKWETQYQSFSFNWATCKLIQQIGNTEVHPEVQSILKLHDGTTRVDSKLKLA